MQRESLRSFFDASPTARLLRSDYAPLVVEFLNHVFKSGESIAVGYLELKTQLVTYQDDLHATEPELLPGSADRYLNQWVENGWLTRFLESNSSEPQFQLTRFAEDAIHFLDASLSKSTALVGTESRLRLVIDSLEDLVRRASADPQQRLNYLRQQRDLINAEISAIESGDSVEVYQPGQVRERFQTAVDLLKALQSDFRAVEERFQEITREVQQRQAKGDMTRGTILGYALDAEDLLKEQDEGVSFFAFVRFLFSPAQQAALRRTIQDVKQLSALATEDESMLRLQRMVPALLAEADKVMKTTARLSATLRRLLDAQSAAHRQRLSSILQDIKKAALQLQGKVPENCELLVDTDPQITSPFARTFWKPSVHFDLSEPAPHVVDLAQVQKMASSFAKLQRLDFRKLRRTINEATYLGASTTLGQLAEATQFSGGVIDLLGYVQIAHDDGHLIDSDQQEFVTISEPQWSDAPIVIKIPYVRFSPKSKSSSIGRRPK